MMQQRKFQRSSNCCKFLFDKKAFWAYIKDQRLPRKTFGHNGRKNVPWSIRQIPFGNVNWDASFEKDRDAVLANNFAQRFLVKNVFQSLCLDPNGYIGRPSK